MLKDNAASNTEARDNPTVRWREKITRRSICLASSQAIAAALFAAPPRTELLFCCDATNDVFQAAGGRYPRYATATDTIRNAPRGSSVLILSDGYPALTTPLSSELFDEALEKQLRLYVEYPSFLPDLACGAPRSTTWERAVVASELFGPELKPSRILAIHGCRYVPVESVKADIVLARVAGFDTAVYGLPQTGVSPILFEHPSAPVLVATTKLSQFVTGRYAPIDAWDVVWKRILRWLSGGNNSTALHWSPVVRPSYSRSARLPSGVEGEAFQRGAMWYGNARLFIHRSWAQKEVEARSHNDRVAEAPKLAWPLGDGSLGMLEGFSSSIQPDGSQPVRWWLRADCMGESSFAMALSEGGRQIAANLNDFIYVRSNLAQGPRASPDSASFGLVGWNTSQDGVYYGDDNARMMLGTMGTASALRSSAWDQPLLRCLVANLRTTGPLGFRGNRLEEADVQKNGWRHYFTLGRVNYAPHFECYLWAAYLWAWDKTRSRPFLDCAKRGITAMMSAYPHEWRWTNGIQQERARMLLPLAWLVRVEPTAEHRGWLRHMASELLAFQDASGAIREEVGSAGKGRYGPPKTNAVYGATEAPLIQNNGDLLSDLLYTTNFAFLGLHEASAATGDRLYHDAETKLAEFLCRIQVRSTQRRELDGAWFRAFDFGRWEYWASNSDVGWGAWSIETGWTQAWITAVLGMRGKGSSLWSLTADSKIGDHKDMIQEMLPDV